MDINRNPLTPQSDEGAGRERAAVSPELQRRLDEIYRTESRRILATLIRLLGDFDLAEEALHDAFTAAIVQWPRDGVPANPRAWLVSTGRFKTIDRLRRRARFDSAVGEIGKQLEEAERLVYAPGGADPRESALLDGEGIEDDRLRLIFICCHPWLSSDGRVALTLREVCDLTTEEIASAFLATPTTIAQRIVRAKQKIRRVKIPYEVPLPPELHERLDAVLQVIYLVFNEGYFASSGASLTRADLSAEAIRLGRLLVDLLPDPEAVGLLALMLLHDSRRPARTLPSGEVVLLEDQDRSLWNREQIAAGVALVKKALSARSIGIYAVQAAIAAVHAEAPSAADTDWKEIAELYDVLLRIDRSPVVELNRAVAVAMRDGPDAGLALVDAILARGDLTDYHLAHAVRGELLRRLGNKAEALASFDCALQLAQQEPEQRLIRRRMAELSE